MHALTHKAREVVDRLVAAFDDPEKPVDTIIHLAGPEDSKDSHRRSEREDRGPAMEPDCADTAGE